MAFCISGLFVIILLYCMTSLVVRWRRRTRVVQLDDVMKALCFAGNKRRLSGGPTLSSDVATTTAFHRQLVPGPDSQLLMRLQSMVEDGIMLENTRYASASTITVKGSGVNILRHYKFETVSFDSADVS